MMASPICACQPCSDDQDLHVQSEGLHAGVGGSSALWPSLNMVLDRKRVWGLGFSLRP